MREQRFFEDEAVDRLLGVLMQLVGEVYVLRDRQAALEQVLARHGIDVAGEIEAGEVALDAAARDAWVERILEPLVQAEEASSRVAAEFRVN